MSGRPLRWAIVGTGVVSGAFARALARVPGQQRQLVVSRELGSAQAFAARHGFAGAQALEPAVFEREDIDIFYIAAPTERHLELSLGAIRAGKAVLCEKPMTASPEQVLALQRAAREAGVFAMEGMWLRFNTVVRQLQARLAAGECGELVAASMQIGYVQASQDPSRIIPSNDALSVFGCYGFSLALQLFGAPRRLMAQGSVRADNGAIEHAQVLLDYGRFTFALEASMVADTRNALELLGRAGRLSIPATIVDPYRLEAERWSGGGGALAKLRRRLHKLGQAVLDQVGFLHPERGSGFRHEIAEISRCLEQGLLESPTNPMAATLACHALEQASRESLRQGGSWQAPAA